MSASIRYAAVAALACALVVTGCGSGGETTAQALSKKQFIKKADAICRQVDADQETDLEKYIKAHPESSASPQGQEKTITQVGLPPVRRAISEIAALPAPVKDEEKIDAIVEGMETALEKVEKEPLSLLGSPAETPFKEADALAQDYGFRDCSEIL